MAVALQPLGGVLWDFARVRPMVLRALSCRSDPRRRSIGILAALGFDLYQSADYAMRSQRVFGAYWVLWPGLFDWLAEQPSRDGDAT